MSAIEPVERAEIATIRKNVREEIRIELNRMPTGKWRIGTRVWFQGEAEMKPGWAGWTLPIEALPELSAALQEALREARDRGILE